MHIISRKTLKDFWARYVDAEQPLKTWFDIAKRSHWQNPSEIKKIYNSADFLADNRIIFNIKGNKYRLIVRINYYSSTIFIRFIGTHAEYNKINAENI